MLAYLLAPFIAGTDSCQHQGAILILGEVESTLLLAPPGHPSPALELHQLLHFRNDEQASRLALALIILSSGSHCCFQEYHSEGKAKDEDISPS